MNVTLLYGSNYWAYHRQIAERARARLRVAEVP